MAMAAAGSITRDGATWRMAGGKRDQGCVYLWRGARGINCSCARFRRTHSCAHRLALIRYLTEALEDFARGDDA
jgi:hypothetical protein